MCGNNQFWYTAEHTLASDFVQETSGEMPAKRSKASSSSSESNSGSCSANAGLHHELLARMCNVVGFEHDGV